MTQTAKSSNKNVDLNSKSLEELIRNKDDLTDFASTLFEFGFYKRASQIYKHLGAISELYEKSDKLRDMGLFKHAITYYNILLELNKDDHEAWNDKGLTYQAMNKFKNAIKCYKKARELYYEYDEAINNEKDAISAQKKYETLKKKLSRKLVLYDQLIKVDPSDINAWKNKAEKLNELGNYMESFECYIVIQQIQDTSTPEIIKCCSDLLKKLNMPQYKVNPSGASWGEPVKSTSPTRPPLLMRPRPMKPSPTKPERLPKHKKRPESEEVSSLKSMFEYPQPNNNPDVELIYECPDCGSEVDDKTDKCTNCLTEFNDL